MAANKRELIRSIKEHEGFRPRPYKDSRGYLTIGYGLNLDAGITEEEAYVIMKIRVRTKFEEITDRYSWFESLSDARQRSLVEMAYQLGSISAFKRMLRALRAGNYDRAADEMLDSLWARQTPVRAEHCAELMRRG